MIIKREISNIVRNEIPEANNPNIARCVIWEKLMITPEGTIQICPGYIKTERKVFVCYKDRYLSFLENKWRPGNVKAVIETIKKRSGGKLNQDIDSELNERSYVEPGTIGKQITRDLTDVGQPVRNDRENDNDALYYELAFFYQEVFIVELGSNEGIGLDRAAPGGVVKSTLCEVLVQLNNGKPEVTGAKLVRSPNIDPSVEVAVPKGAGIPISEYNRRRSVELDINNKGARTVSRIRGGLQRYRNLYVGACDLGETDISRDGDVWLEGVKSSVTNGLYEVWTDNLNIGPMLKITRQKVQEASSRYIRKVAAGEQRYASERDNPLAADMASTALTPIRVYIEDWFGDPNFYLGLANTLMAIASGLDLGQNRSSYKNIYYDAGAFDYGKIYNNLSGRSI